MDANAALREYLEWLITPQDDAESWRFRVEGLVDDYIAIKNRISGMSHDELVKEINTQLAPCSLAVHTDVTE
jgi:hypothetical protein